MKSRVELKEELEIYKERLENAMEAGNLAWWEMELPSGKVRFNSGKAHMLGYDPERFEHYTDFTDLLHPEDHDRAMQAMRAHLQGNEPRYEVTYRIKKKDNGYKWFRDVGKVTEADEDGEYKKVTGIVIDIDASKEAERQIAELNDTLRLLNKIMRHDIVNHMQVTQSAIELYEESEDEELLEKASRRMQQGISLIKRMRGLESMVATGKKLEPIDVREVAEEVMADCTIECSVDGEAVVMADEALHSVLRNLLDNAVKHGDASHVAVELSCSDDACTIRVADDGTGIPDEAKERLFEEGFSHGDSAGSGLGLYIVRQTVERYGGSIRVEDNEPQGTVFDIQLQKGGTHE